MYAVLMQNKKLQSVSMTPYKTKGFTLIIVDGFVFTKQVFNTGIFSRIFVNYYSQ